MGRKDVRVIPWKYVTTLQFVISASVINTSVPSRQYVLPYSPYFTKKTTSLSWDEIGYVSGALSGSYILGRALATPFWLYLADLCGRRAVLSMCFMFSLVLTMFFGLCSTFVTAVIVRLCLGLFSPVFSLSHSLLRELSSPCMEKLPLVSLVTGLNVIGSMAAGLFIGAFTVPQSEFEGQDEEHKFGFLSCSLISAAVTLFAFIAFFVDFPETMGVAAELKKKAIKAGERPKGKDLPGKYVELTETGGVDEIKQETKGDVVTERKDQEEEDLPGYLAHFAMQAEEKSEEERDNGESQKSEIVDKGSRFFSPRTANVPKVYLNPRPNTTRAASTSPTLPELDEAKEPISTSKSPSDGKTSDNEEIKRTHISFFEEDFSPADVTTTQFPQSTSELTLDDKFGRVGENAIWRSSAFRSAVGVYVAVLVVALSVKEANIVWLVADSPQISLSVEALGAMLIITSTLSQCISTYLGSRITTLSPLNRFSVCACFTLALITLMMPYPDWIPQKWTKVIVCGGAMTAFEGVLSALGMAMVLRISDSVVPAERETAMRWCTGLSSLAKTFATFLGPALLSASFTGAIPMDYHLIYAVAGCSLFLCSGLLLWTRSSFPRFDTCPYEI